jgi:hypothetical protein
VDVLVPAGKANEVRRLDVPGATAEYAIAKLTRSWAVKIRCAYLTGNQFGASSPWEEKPSREACVDAFLEDALRHFRAELHNPSAYQAAARVKMLELLEGGLFFTEPPVKS